MLTVFSAKFSIAPELVVSCRVRHAPARDQVEFSVSFDPCGPLGLAGRATGSTSSASLIGKCDNADEWNLRQHGHMARVLGPPPQAIKRFARENRPKTLVFVVFFAKFGPEVGATGAGQGVGLLLAPFCDLAVVPGQ